MPYVAKDIEQVGLKKQVSIFGVKRSHNERKPLFGMTKHALLNWTPKLAPRQDNQIEKNYGHQFKT
jgi:hypothetical protein